ncbi:hypothetical protein C0J52_02525 [Blattella germanica]|nr:hypothetical protein C0J52_02525 [Blattella germanica]
MTNLGLKILKVVPAMWEALNTISLSMCKSGYLLAHSISNVLCSHVTNRLPSSGSLILVLLPCQLICTVLSFFCTVKAYCPVSIVIN